MKALWPDLKGYRAQLVLGPLFKLAEAILELLVPLLMADIIDVGVKTGDVRYIVTHGLAMLGLGAVGLGCALTCQYFAAVCAQGFGRSLRRRLFFSSVPSSAYFFTKPQTSCGVAAIFASHFSHR